MRGDSPENIRTSNKGQSATQTNKMSERRFCFLCHESDLLVNLIHSCDCNLPAHASCIEKERLSKHSSQVNQCTRCHTIYDGIPMMDVIPLPTRYVLYVIRDVLAFWVLVILAIVIHAFVAQAIDVSTCTWSTTGESTCFVRYRLLPSSWSSTGVYTLCGVVLFLAEIGLVGTIYSLIQCCRRSDCGGGGGGGNNTCIYIDGGGGSSSRGGGDGGGCGGDDDGGALVVCILFFAVLGIFYAMYIVVQFVGFVIQRHFDKLYVQAVVMEYPVNVRDAVIVLV